MTLKDGTPATVHRFLAKSMCFGLGGNGDSIYHRSFNFRPYAQFKEASAEGSGYFNVWDAVESDYNVGFPKYPFTVWVKSFDRQGELLKP